MPRLVLAGLGMAYLLGQGEQLGRTHQHTLLMAVGVAADVVAVLIVCAGVSLWWYLRHGHPVPGHYPRRPAAAPVPIVREVVALAEQGEVTEMHPGVWAMPSVPPVESENAAVLPNRSVGGGTGIDTLEDEGDVR